MSLSLLEYYLISCLFPLQTVTALTAIDGIRNFRILIATEDANEKLKFNISFFLQHMVQRYFILIRLTDQGIRDIKDTTRRADASRSEAEKLGCKYTLYWTFGEYDAIGMLEAPNDETAMELNLKIGSLGSVRTTTLRAFTEEEIAKMIDFKW